MTYTFHVNIYKSLCKTIEHKCICKKLLFNETNAKPDDSNDLVMEAKFISVGLRNVGIYANDYVLLQII